MSAILVRATIHLPDFPAQTEGWVDTESEYVQDCLARQFLVPVEPQPTDEAAISEP